VTDHNQIDLPRIEIQLSEVFHKDAAVGAGVEENGFFQALHYAGKTPGRGQFGRAGIVIINDGEFNLIVGGLFMSDRFRRGLFRRAACERQRQSYGPTCK